MLNLLEMPNCNYDRVRVLLPFCACALYSKGGADWWWALFPSAVLESRLNTRIQLARGVPLVSELHSERNVLEEPSVSKKLLPFKFYV